MLGRIGSFFFAIFSTTEGKGLKACTRKGVVFEYKMCTRKGMVFGSMCTRKGMVFGSVCTRKGMGYSQTCTTKGTFLEGSTKEGLQFLHH